LQADRGEQHDMAAEHPDVLKRLQQTFETMLAEVRSFPVPPSDYLFEPPRRGTPRVLMRLIGGELRYDRVPTSQQHLLRTAP
ncbi:MAG: hypothetical protein ABGZ24_27405, partial [Fuerstiella sp.]